MIEKYLFSPGPVPGKWELTLDYSHRSERFAELYKECQTALQRMTSRQVVLVQGSASAAMETVLASLIEPATKVGVFSDGVFAKRARNTAAIYAQSVWEMHENVSVVEREKLDIVIAVQFETSESRYFDLKELGSACYLNGTLLVVDAVSAFPYYQIPDNTDIAILSSAKQLQGLPVMGIIAFEDRLFHGPEAKGPLPMHERSEYLSLYKLLQYRDSGQTPHTPMWPQMETLAQSLRSGLWMRRVTAITKNSELIVSGRRDKVIGDKIAPVITLRVKDRQKLQEYLLKEGLECYWNQSYMTDQMQVSTFNYHQTEPYMSLAEALRGAEKMGWL